MNFGRPTRNNGRVYNLPLDPRPTVAAVASAFPGGASVLFRSARTISSPRLSEAVTDAALSLLIGHFAAWALTGFRVVS